jgi:hypothetical protein
LKYFVKIDHIKTFTDLSCFFMSCICLCSFILLYTDLHAKPLVSNSSKNLEINHHERQKKLLQKIPQDSWYIFALHNVSQNFEAKSIEQSYQQTYRKLDQYFNQNLSKEHARYETIQELKELWAQIQLPSSLEEWRVLGITHMPFAFMYSIQYMPSLLIELPNTQEWTNWWLKQQNWVQTKLTQQELQGQQYWRLALKRWVLIAVMRQTILQITWIPSTQEQEMIPLVLKPVTKTITSLWDDKKTKFHGESTLGGWIDLEKIFSNAMKLPSQLPREIALSLGVQPETLSACQAELQSITKHIPRISIASRTQKLLKDKSVPTYWIQTLLELSPRLQTFFHNLSNKIPAPIPATPDFHVSLSLNFSFLFNQLITLHQSWSQHPWRCSLLKNLNGLSTMSQSPQFIRFKPMFYNLQGISLHIDHDQNKLNSTSNNYLKAWLSMRYPNVQIPLSLIQQHQQAPTWLKNTILHLNGQPTPIVNAPTNWYKPHLSLSSYGLLLASGYEQQDIHQNFHQGLVQFHAQESFNHDLHHLLSITFSPKTIRIIQNKVAQLKVILQGKESKEKKIKKPQDDKGLSIDYVGLFSTKFGVLIEQKLIHNQ